MKITYLYLLLGGLLVFSCTTKQTKTQESPMTEDEVSEEEDKSQRPSPPASTTANIQGVDVTLDYSSPAVKGREIWGNLVAYDKVWRTGANEANVFTTEGDILVNGQMLPKGQYSLFTIPSEEKWTVIFNKVANQWGAYDYDAAQDVLRVEVEPESADSMQERLMFDIKDNGQLQFQWENLRFRLSLEPAA